MGLSLLDMLPGYRLMGSGAPGDRGLVAFNCRGTMAFGRAQQSVEGDAAVLELGPGSTGR